MLRFFCSTNLSSGSAQGPIAQSLVVDGYIVYAALLFGLVPSAPGVAWTWLGS